MTFRELCVRYRTSIASIVRIEAALPGEDRPWEQKVLMHKLLKRADEPRNAAKYIAAYLEAFGRELDADTTSGFGLPPEAVALAGRLSLRWSAEYGVGYPHADGTYHFFSVR